MQSVRVRGGRRGGRRTTDAESPRRGRGSVRTYVGILHYVGGICVEAPLGEAPGQDRKKMRIFNTHTHTGWRRGWQVENWPGKESALKRSLAEPRSHGPPLSAVPHVQGVRLFNSCFHVLLVQYYLAIKNGARASAGQ